MNKLICYKFDADKIEKIFCQLTAKCYASDQNTTVFIQNDSLIQRLDKVLWTFSEKNFIPHATCWDPLPEMQPVYLTNELVNINSSKIIMLILPTKQVILDLISTASNDLLQSFDKILCLVAQEHELRSNELYDLMQKSYIDSFTIRAFEFTHDNLWSEYFLEPV